MNTDKRKRYDVNDPDRVRAPAGVPPEDLERAANIILAARARRLRDAEVPVDPTVHPDDAPSPDK